MSFLGRNWRFLTISVGSASLALGKNGRIRKPPFYSLTYGNSENWDFRFLTADCKQVATCRGSLRGGETQAQKDKERTRGSIEPLRNGFIVTQSHAEGGSEPGEDETPNR